AVAAAREGLGVSILLPTAPIGPGDTRPTPPGALLRDLAAGRLPALLDSVINLVDVRQVADAAMTALDRGAPGRRYLLAGEDVTLHDLARRVAKLCGARAPRFTAPAAAALLAAHAEQLYARLSKRPPTAPLTGVRIAMRRRRFSAARARAELDFAPGTIDAALADALREIAPLCEPAQAKG
ncbi:MAG: NAD-dependent epimerase, partial [Pseudomonadota bacterium]